MQTDNTTPQPTDVPSFDPTNNGENDIEKADNGTNTNDTKDTKFIELSGSIVSSPSDVESIDITHTAYQVTKDFISVASSASGAVTGAEGASKSASNIEDEIGITKRSTGTHATFSSDLKVSTKHPINNAFSGRQAQRIARHPCKHLWAGLIISLIISAVGIIVGEFSAEADVGGWNARGTPIADRSAQLELTQYFANDLFYDDAAWDDLLDNVQIGREVLHAQDAARAQAEKAERDRLRFEAQNNRRLSAALQRRLEEPDVDLTTCEAEWHGSQYMFDQSRLWPIWKVQRKSDNVLSPEALFEICEAEQATQQLLMENDLCFGCDGTSANGCFQPYSVVLFARTTVQDGMSMSCTELRDAWAPDAEQWKECATSAAMASNGTFSVSESCPPFFSPTFVDAGFADSGVIDFTSSIFATRQVDAEDLLELLDDFDRAGPIVSGAYDTQNEDFVNLTYDGSLLRDVALAMASAIIIGAAMLVHTRSPFITIMGILQVVLSLPVSFFFYKIVAGIEFFPFLNFISVFVIFSIGADDVFVAFDRFKNTRIDMPDASTVHVASVALPEAASAMFVTTLTTAIAFFATAICPVAPVKCFGIYLGFLVVFDYMLNIMLVFPALCIYDASSKNSNCFVGCCMSLKCLAKKDENKDENAARDDVAEPESPLFIRRVFMAYYRLLHRVRWPLLAISAAAFAVSCYYTTQLGRPDSVAVRLLSDSLQSERNYVWRKELLSTTLESANQFSTSVVWGLKPTDTGDHSNPKTWTQLVLDETFEPSSEDAQRHLLEYCPKLYSQEFALAPSDFRCSIERFDYWLQDQAASVEPDEAYSSKCNGAKGLPMDSDSFHPCLVAWSKMVNETSILSRNDRVKIIWFPFTSRVRLDNGYDELDKEWKLIEAFTSEQNDMAPSGVNTSYFSSVIYRIYDSTGQMFNTAYGSAAIALVAAAIVIFITTRSVLLTLFATLSVGYVLTSVTAILVGLGWTLGYIESICFAVLIGVSVDFVAHFSHAFASLPGKVDRSERTQHALISMGPSVLAAAFTTMASSLIMIFTVITFFQQFAVVLLLTIAQAVVASFVVFLSISDCFGPENPTRFVDNYLTKMSELFCRRSSNEKNETHADSPNVGDSLA